jgi:tetratricopeptide (TPR) repeat protein
MVKGTEMKKTKTVPSLIVLAALTMLLSFMVDTAHAKEPMLGIDTLKERLKENPDDGEAYKKLGELYSEAKEYELAERHFNKSISLGIKEQDVAYELGYAYSRLGIYDKAKNKLTVALANDEDRAKAYLELGYCYLKTMEFPKAEENLDKAIELDQTLTPKAKLYKGIIKYEQKNYDGAYADLDESVTTAADPVTRASAENYLSAIKKAKRAEKDYMLIASLSVVYDDNVVTANDSGPTRISNRDDIGAVGYFRGVYYPVKRESDLFLVSYMFYQKLYQDLHAFDLQDHSGLLQYTTMKSDAGSLSLKYNYDYYSLNGGRYFQRNRFMPVVTAKETDNATIEIRGLIESKEYFTTTELSGRNFGFGLTQSFDLRYRRKLSLSIDYNAESTRDNDYEYDSYKLKLGLNQVLSYGIDGDLTLGYSKKDYLHIHSVFGKRRDDEVQTASLRLQKEFGDSIVASLRYEYTLNASNIGFYDYKRNVTFLQLKYIY